VTNETFVEFMRDAVWIAKLERLYGHRLSAGLSGQLRMSTADRWIDRRSSGASAGAEIKDLPLGNKPEGASREQPIDGNS
jgi:hypothetical protein